MVIDGAFEQRLTYTPDDAPWPGFPLYRLGSGPGTRQVASTLHIKDYLRSPLHRGRKLPGVVLTFSTHAKSYLV